MNKIKVYLEVGKKQVFACAVDWPMWCRSGRNEDSALQALLEYGPRLAKVLLKTDLGFRAPQDSSDFEVIAQLEGNATTDFGGPGVIPEADKTSLDQNETPRIYSLLQACWDAFDASVQSASSKELLKGPRGGGRDLEKMKYHVLEADKAYLRRLAWKPANLGDVSFEDELKYIRQEIISALEKAVLEGLPEVGSRGGKIWPARYFVRRVAWHVLDHTWEIEDRIV